LNHYLYLLILNGAHNQGAPDNVVDAIRKVVAKELDCNQSERRFWEALFRHWIQTGKRVSKALKVIPEHYRLNANRRR
jgi:hypothetical protein